MGAVKVSWSYLGLVPNQRPIQIEVNHAICLTNHTKPVYNTVVS